MLCTPYGFLASCKSIHHTNSQKVLPHHCRVIIILLKAISLIKWDRFRIRRHNFHIQKILIETHDPFFTGLNAVKPQMIEEATKNARAAAIKFAKDSDSELGKIKRAYQGQFSIEDRDANTPYIKRIRVVTTIDYSLED